MSAGASARTSPGRKAAETLKAKASGATKAPSTRRWYLSSKARKTHTIANAEKESDSKRLVIGVYPATK